MFGLVQILFVICATIYVAEPFVVQKLLIQLLHWLPINGLVPKADAAVIVGVFLLSEMHGKPPANPIPLL
jgi:hypothetical protein